MTDRPIIMSGPMVRALLDGRKTQTRRVLKPQPVRGFDGWDWGWSVRREGVTPGTNILWRNDAKPLGLESYLPYQPGDQLWVREKHWCVEIEGGGIGCPYLVYDDEWTDGPGAKTPAPQTERIWWGPPYDGDPRFGARPSIHMPRWASRLTLLVTDVRVQRLRKISCADAIAEGIAPAANSQTIDCETPDPRHGFRDLWNSLHKPGKRWEDNPWVVALTFKVVQTNIDQLGEAA